MNFCNYNCNPCRNDCDPCNKKECGDPCEKLCGCPEPAFSIEPLSDDPTVLRYNINGKNYWYDYKELVRDAETCTSIVPDSVNRNLDYHGECGDYSITHEELGSILHLADLGDVNANSIEDYGILSYRKGSNCGEGCEGADGGWVAENPIDVGTSQLSYVLGSDGDGKLQSLMPPTNTNKYYYLAWAAQNKASWQSIPEVASAPTDSDGKVWRLYVDPATGQIVVVKENP